MKIRSLILALCAAGYFVPGAFRANANLEVSAGVSINSTADFYGPLAERGKWLDVGHYGRCWRPEGIVSGWRPYCHGTWEWTYCGWYWQSDEPWAWACYHYGSWILDPNDGWVWVPGVEWAPAWVCWRSGGDYIGWAPYGPSGVVADPSSYVFVESRHFHDQVQPNTVIVNNETVIRQTTETKNVQRDTRRINGTSQTVVVNNGPDVAMVSRATGHKYSAVSVREADQATIRSVPETLKHRTVSAPQSSAPLNPAGNQPRELPGNSQPNHERIIPQNSPDITIPPSQPRELPKVIVPPNQPIHPSAPIVPPSQPVHPSVPVVPPNQPIHPVIPPVQPVHPAIPIVPPNQPVHPAVPVVPPNQPQPIHPVVPVVPPNQPQHPPENPPANGNG